HRVEDRAWRTKNQERLTTIAGDAIRIDGTDNHIIVSICIVITDKARRLTKWPPRPRTLDQHAIRPGGIDQIQIHICSGGTGAAKNDIGLATIESVAITETDAQHQILNTVAIEITARIKSLPIAGITSDRITDCRA